MNALATDFRALLADTSHNAVFHEEFRRYMVARLKGASEWSDEIDGLKLTGYAVKVGTAQRDMFRIEGDGAAQEFEACLEWGEDDRSLVYLIPAAEMVPSLAA